MSETDKDTSISGDPDPECPNRPEWAEPNTPAVSPEGLCFHCSRVRNEWVRCEGWATA